MVAMHQASFRLQSHAQRYLKVNTKHATAFAHLQAVGFDSSTVYAGFQLGTKLRAWALCITFRRFIFLCQLNAMLEGAAEMSTLATVRPSVFHWMSLISLFEDSELCCISRPEDNDDSDSDSESSATDASKVEKKRGFQDVYKLKVIVEGVFPDEDTPEAETPKPFPYYSPPASEGCDDDDLKTQLSEDGTIPANAEDWDSNARNPLLLAIGKSLE